MASKLTTLLFIVLTSFRIILSYGTITGTAADNGTTTIGAIIDADSRAGKEQKIAMTIAVQKFNRNSNNHKLAIHFRNSNGDPLQAAVSGKYLGDTELTMELTTRRKVGLLSGTEGVLSNSRDSMRLMTFCVAAEELIKEKQVQVIIGTHTWEEAALVANIGQRAQVPLISFSAADITPSLVRLQWPFLVQMVSDSSEEISCIAAMVHSYNWRRVIVIYEENTYGGESRKLVSLSEALHSVGSEIEHRLVLPPLSSLSDAKEIVSDEVAKILAKQSRVFIVLQSSLPVATHLFKEAKRMTLMRRDSVWILTESVSSLLDSVNTSVFSSMQGALGIKTYYSEDSKPFLDFKARFRETFKLDHPEEDRLEPGIHALRAYDSVTAVSQVVEKLGSESSNGSKILLDEILSSNFSGLSGDIRFHNGKLSDTPILGIINIVGKSYKELGFWSSKSGFSDSRGKTSGGETVSMKALTALVNWPGDLKNRDPKGWAMPTIEKPLKIGVPGATSFDRFVKVTRIESSNETEVTGFCIDVFKEVLGVLETEQGYTLPYDFEPHNGSYDDMVEHVYNKTYDAVIGDVTILASRSKYVEFTQPFAESGLSMVVPVKPEPQKAWKFMRPFTNEMWLASFGILFYTMFVVWFMEHQSNEQFRGPWKDQLGTALWFTFSSLFFAHKEKIQSNYSKVVVMMWLFVVFILTSSYTASLTSMLTVRMLEPTVTNIESLRRTNATVGCDPDSFVATYLKDVLRLENIKNVSNQHEYPKKFKSGAITAAFLELPYLSLFLKEYCNQYMSTGPTYRFGGQGFVFQKGSPIANDVSEAILTLSERGVLQELENKWFNSSSCSDSNSGMDSERLRLDSFLGLFIISATISTTCFLLYLVHLLKKQLRQLEPYNETSSNQSHWSKAFRLLQIVLRLHNGRTVFPTIDEWESVSPSEIPEHLEIALVPTEIQIPARTFGHNG